VAFSQFGTKLKAATAEEITKFSKATMVNLNSELPFLIKLNCYAVFPFARRVSDDTVYDMGTVFAARLRILIKLIWSRFGQTE
jgi:hypothetical protein